MIWKTIKAVIWDAITPFYISMEDWSVYHIREAKDPYDDRSRIEHEEVKDISKIDIHYQLDLWIINDEQYDQLRKEEELKLERENQNKKDKLKKFKNLIDELEVSLDHDSMKLLRDLKHLL